MVAPMSTSPDGTVPNVHDVENSFRGVVKLGHDLRTARLTAAQERLEEVLREHTRTLLYMETHGRPNSEFAAEAELEPACFVSFHAIYDSACKAIQDSIASLSHPSKQQQPAQQDAGATVTDVNQLLCLLRCVEVLVHALGWALQPANPTQHTANVMSALQHRFDEAAAQATTTTTTTAAASPAVPKTTTNTTTTTTTNHGTIAAAAAAAGGSHSALASLVEAWVRQGESALADLARFVTATYPYGAWFGHRNRRAAVRSRRLRHPSDIDTTPFLALLRAAGSTQDEDVSLLSEALLAVAQAHITCLAAVRATETRPAATAALADLFAPLNAALNTLSATCEDVISRREDDRPHAHAVLEAGNLFTWLTTRQEPCVVAEEAFGSANTYLNKITARGNVLLLQQETGYAVDHPELTKAMVTWASMLREVLQRVMLMVVYRYPRHVPWGELVETSMSRSQPRPPSQPRSGSREGQTYQQPLWRRAASASASLNNSAPALPTAPPPPQNTTKTAPPAASAIATTTDENSVTAVRSTPPSLPPPPPPPPSSTLPPPPPPPPPPASANVPESTNDNFAAAAAAVAVDDAVPRCVFDAVTSTWIIQHYRQPLVSAVSGEEQEPVFVTLPDGEVQQSHLVRISHCFNAYVTVPTKVKGVALEHCQHTKLQLAAVVGPVRISDTEKQEMLIEASAPSVYATRVTGLIIHLAGSHETEIITKLTTDVNVNVMVEMPDGDTEVRELALPAQYISTIGEGDTLTTKEVTYSG